MARNDRTTAGPFWTRNWIEKMWRFTAENFVDFDTGSVDFEALGREEYEFRKALFYRKFKNSPRAKEAFEESNALYMVNVERGKKGGRPRKETINGDTATREGADESTTVSNDMGRVAQNGTHPRIQGGDRGAQAAMFPSPSGAAQDGKISTAHTSGHKQNGSAKSQGESNTGSTVPAVRPESGNIYDQEASPISTNEERQIQGRTGGSSVPPVRSRASFRNKEDFIQWAIDDGLDPVDAGECWEATEERHGKDADGNTVKNMKAFARQWCRTRANNRRTA